jgi:hypothetical protein
LDGGAADIFILDSRLDREDVLLVEEKEPQLPLYDRV